MIDLAIAGGGPAGLATALFATRAGLDCAVLEPRPAPIDKACGEGLMPAAVAALDSLGVPVPGIPLRGIRYLDGTVSADADFPRAPGRGVRRLDLHAALHAAAEAAGVRVLNERVADVADRGDSVCVNGLAARYLVGADGLHSRVRGLAGLAAGPSGTRRRWGTRAHFALAPWTDRVEVHWNERAEAYVTPVAAGCVGVAILSPEQRTFGDHLAGFPRLASRLDPVAIGQIHGAGPMRQQTTSRVSGRTLLVGDAAGYIDALTGEGLSIAFCCARAVVQRLAIDDPAGYELDYRRITRRYRRLTTALLRASARPRLRRSLVPLASRCPWLFQRAVAQLAR